MSTAHQANSEAAEPTFFEPNGASREGLDRRRLFRVLDYIDENLQGDLTIDRMASIACLSKYHFARTFKRAVGQSPHRYVSAKRLDQARALLTQSDRSLVDIALALRFSSQASFTRAFGQATGQTPGQYRQRAWIAVTQIWRTRSRQETCTADHFERAREQDRSKPA